MSDIASQLRGMEFFHGIADEYLERLAAISKVVEFPARQEIFREHEPAKDVYFIVSGRVSLIICEPPVGCRQLVEVDEGELIGWSPLVGRSRLSDTAWTLTPTKAVAVEGKRILELSAADPQFGFEFMKLRSTNLGLALGCDAGATVEAGRRNCRWRKLNRIDSSAAAFPRRRSSEMVTSHNSFFGQRRIPMRLFLALAICLMIPAWVNADDSSNAVKQAPTDEAVINLCGQLPNVFARFGPPEDVRASGDNDGGADLDYGSFGFKIKNKTALACFFWSDWKGPVKGVKIGDSKEQAVKVLGANKHTFKHPDGLEDFGWDLTTPNAILWLYFDKDSKVKKIDTEIN